MFGHQYTGTVGIVVLLATRFKDTKKCCVLYTADA